MRRFAVLLALCAAPALADTVPPDKAQVLTCLDAMGTETDWGQCVTLMFAPCAMHKAGSADHVACLSGQHESWMTVMQEQREVLLPSLTPTGRDDLTRLMGQWFGYVAQKCAAVASDKTGTGAEAAQLGCEISEIAGVTGEFVACRDGRSTAPYCIMQE